jgi:hypothetical protein
MRIHLRSRIATGFIVLLIIIIGCFFARSLRENTYTITQPKNTYTEILPVSEEDISAIPQVPSTLNSQSQVTIGQMTNISTVTPTAGICNLPCFQNIIPGITTWADGSSLAKNIGEMELLESGTIQSELGEIRRVEDYRVKRTGIQQNEVFIIGRNEDLVSYITLENPQPAEDYSLRNLLLTEGVPTKVFFTTVEGRLEGKLPAMTMIMSYEDKNFTTIYTTIQESSNEMITGCFEDGPIIDIYSSNHHLTSDFLKRRIGDAEFDKIFTTTEAFGLSIQGFYDYIIGNGNNCIQTQSSIWR